MNDDADAGAGQPLQSANVKSRRWSKLNFTAFEFRASRCKLWGMANKNAPKRETKKPPKKKTKAAR
jgi:hypothetical protein